MKFFHIIETLSIGGAEVLLKDTVNLLPQFDHYIIYLSEPSEIKSMFRGGIQFICLSHTSWLDSIRTVKRIRRLIEKHEPDLVHAHLFKATVLARMGCNKRTPFYFTIHNVLSKDAFLVNRASLWLEKLTYRRRHHLIGVSKEVIDDYSKWVGIKGAATVLYNLINDRFFNLNYNDKRQLPNQLKLVAVGNLRRQKNYVRLLEAMHLLNDDSVSLDIYGEGEMYNELNDVIARQGLNVRLMGRISDVATVLLNYDAFIMPSLFEGYGIAPLEAMAAGMPVLLSDLPVFMELCEDGALYFDPSNSRSIADAIMNLRLTWNVWMQKSHLNKQMVSEKSSKQTYLSGLLRLYNIASELN